MERILTVIFDDEKKAYEGTRALDQLDFEDSVSVHAEAVVNKNPDGTLGVKQTRDDLPIRTLGGTALGALIGVLGGPIGLGIGASAGALVGGMADINRAGVNADYLSDVSARLTPCKWALVADISEEWVTPVDTRMEELGGTVFRATRWDVEDEQDERDIAALKADIAQLMSEQAKARADQKAKLQGKIDKLQLRLNTKSAHVKERLEQREKETQAKVQSLEKKAAKAKGDAKAALEARIAQLRKESTGASQKLEVVT